MGNDLGEKLADEDRPLHDTTFTVNKHSQYYDELDKAQHWYWAVRTPNGTLIHVYDEEQMNMYGIPMPD